MLRARRAMAQLLWPEFRLYGVWDVEDDYVSAQQVSLGDEYGRCV